MKLSQEIIDHVLSVMKSHLTSTEKFYFILPVLKYLNQITIFCQIKEEIVVP